MFRFLVLYAIAAVSVGAPQGYNYQVPLPATRPISQNYLPPTHYQTVISKNFYLHAAPEEPQEEALHKTINIGPSHKHYRVVFIKAPAQSSQAAKITLAQAQNEEKTVIYVLSKKTDATDIQAELQSVPTEPSKPEVFFIKYKTPEEAAHAQQQIQAQYDSLGGTSHVSDEGYAPVQSVIGALGTGPDSTTHTHTHGITATHISTPNSAYLPVLPN